MLMHIKSNVAPLCVIECENDTHLLIVSTFRSWPFTVSYQYVYVIGSEKRVNFAHIPIFGFKTLITHKL